VPLKDQPPTEAKQPPAPVLPKPAPVHLESVKWRVVLHSGQVYFALDAKGYEALSRNISELTTWAGEASWQLDFYRRSRIPKTDGAPK
jgi:hypothetical protein